VVNIRIGSVHPLLTSASGVIFAAFQTRKMIEEERTELRRKGYEAWLARANRSTYKARETGLAVGNILTPRVSAISAPIFDYRGRIAGALTALGPAKILAQRPARWQLWKAVFAFPIGLCRSFSSMRS
jgi:DNA-binding IclR family transcriptional regulator